MDVSLARRMDTDEIKTALKAALRRCGWLLALIVPVNLGHQYWRGRDITFSDCLGVLLGVLLVILGTTLFEAYRLRRNRRKSAS